MAVNVIVRGLGGGGGRGGHWPIAFFTHFATYLAKNKVFVLTLTCGQCKNRTYKLLPGSESIVLDLYWPKRSQLRAFLLWCTWISSLGHNWKNHDLFPKIKKHKLFPYVLKSRSTYILSGLITRTQGQIMWFQIACFWPRQKKLWTPTNLTWFFNLENVFWLFPGGVCLGSYYLLQITGF